MFNRIAHSGVRFQGMRLLWTALLLSWISASGYVWAQTGVPGALNTPETVTASITPGSTSVNIPFTVTGADGLRLDVIVPTDNAQFALIAPSGAVAFPVVEYNPGSSQTPPLPGGVFTTSEILAPEDGVWTIRLTFPAAPTQTVALATVYARSRYQAGIAIARDRFLVGEDASIGMLIVDNGQPVKSLNPAISVGPAGPVPAMDNGADPDGLANDGIYSIGNVFSQSGTYRIVGTVTIPTPKGPVSRRAERTVEVVEPGLALTSVATTIVKGAGNCVSGINTALSYNVAKVGNYVTHAQLGAPNGKSIYNRTNRLLNTGPNTVTVSFAAKDIKKAGMGDGPYNLSLKVLEVSAMQGFTLTYQKVDVVSLPIKLADICSDPVELQDSLTVTPTLKNGFIGSLNFSFPVRVQSAGTYQISFKIIGVNGADVELVSISRSLSVSMNVVTASVPSDKFLGADGPYKAISLLVVGGASSARLDTVGQSSTFQRWQFYPNINADLNNDGSVDAADQGVLLQYRANKALSPGDRRDLNKDGVIDIRDVRATEVDVYGGYLYCQSLISARAGHVGSLLH